MVIMESSMWDIISNFPTWVQVFIVILTLSLALLGGFKGIKDLLLKVKGEKVTKRKVYVASEIDIINHPIFGIFTHFLDHEVNMLNFGDEKRNKIFRLILRTQFRTYNNILYKMATKDISNISIQELRTLVFEVYNRIVNDYNIKIKEALGVELYNLIMNHTIRGYNTWHEPVLQMIKDSLDDILSNEMYDNNYEIIFAILNSYKNSLKSVKMNVQNTYRNFNGELDKLIR